MFARDAQSQVAYQKLLDGHLDDFSITATPLESHFIQRGDWEEIKGVKYDGPAEIVSSWSPTDASLVAAGADELAKVRRSYDTTIIRKSKHSSRRRQRAQGNLQKRTQKKGNPMALMTKTGIDKVAAAVRDGMITRAFRRIDSKNDPFKGKKRAKGAEDFESSNFLRAAEAILRSGGINTGRLSNPDIAMVAMGQESVMHRCGIQRDSEAYHVTGMLPNILMDASNLTLQDGYQEAPATWKVWAKEAMPADDMKMINRTRFGESDDLDEIPEGRHYPEGGVSDARESYQVSKFGKLFTVSWETIINDSLDAISRIPQMHGKAAIRTQNKRVYAIVTANAAMSDNVALFHADHNNLAGSGLAISVAALNSAWASLKTQTGLNDNVIIDVLPRFLIVPEALSAIAEQLVGSTADPAVGGSVAGNSNTHNIYGPQGSRKLEVVSEPLLDNDSITAWYLASDHTVLPTVELAFLTGEENPILEMDWDMTRDVWRYKIRQTFGTKAIDWRGLYKNPGA